MRTILGIDAAWTQGEPSGVALIQGEREAWSVLGVAPSYDAFVACSQGAPVDWQASRFTGSRPNVASLIKAAREMASAELSVVGLDVPIANVRFESRRTADDAISKAFGGRGCSAHSPSAARPGRLGRSLMAQFEAEGFPLATTAPRPADTRCTIEVYPHPALLALLRRDYRVPYKVSRSTKYWPGTSVSERVLKLLAEFAKINDALGAVFGGAPISLPRGQEVATLAALKRYEDALDALVCAWVGLRFVEGTVAAYGDESAAIWVPKSEAPAA